MKILLPVKPEVPPKGNPLLIGITAKEIVDALIDALEIVGGAYIASKGDNNYKALKSNLALLGSKIDSVNTRIDALELRLKSNNILGA